MNVSKEVEKARKDIRTDDYPMSIGEWISLYEGGELDIHPEFQRFFRWDEQQKSNLIESILLGIPLPSIFVSQRKDGVWDVIDGLQRLSTIFQFIGILKGADNQPFKAFALRKTQYLPSLEGILWQTNDEKLLLPDDLKRSIKRSKIHVSIILKESDENTKYELFQRLNTGGSQLSPQEVRNCILVMENHEFYKWVHEISKFEPFVSSLALSDKPIAEAYDMEQVLRFLMLAEATDEELAEVGDLGVYLTAKMVEMVKDPAFDKKQWRERFEATFKTLFDAVGDKAFKRYNVEKKRHEGGFLVSQFETVSCGVEWNIHRGTLRDDLTIAVQELWSLDEFTKWTGAGLTAARRLKKLVPFAREHFKKK